MLPQQKVLAFQPTMNSPSAFRTTINHPTAKNAYKIAVPTSPQNAPANKSIGDKNFIQSQSTNALFNVRNVESNMETVDNSTSFKQSTKDKKMVGEVRSPKAKQQGQNF